MAPSKQFWEGKRVLLTGHTGFKGSWLSLWLSQLGARVTGFSNKVPTERSIFEDAEIGGLLEDRCGDVRDEAAVGEAVASTNPDIVFHLAAQPLVRYSYDNPLETFATNVMGTTIVLDHARRAGCPVIVVTSDKCYENRKQLWGYRENEAMGGHDPYSASKGCAELVTSAFARSYPSVSGFRVMSGRAGNVIGGGDWAEDRLVPDLVRGLESGNSVPIRNPEAIRPWQHVLEPLCGYLLLAERLFDGKGASGEGWNFGPDNDAEVPVRRIADTVCRLWDGRDGWHFAGVPGQVHEAEILRLDSTKARTGLGWRPRWSLDEALAASVEVYRSNARGCQLRQLLSDQISRYAAS